MIPNDQSHKRPGVRSWLTVVWTLVVIAGCGRGPSETFSPEPITLTGETMGTTYVVKLSALPQKTSTGELQTEIDRRLETVNAQMSTWRDDSELSRFNAAQSTDWFEVSPEVVTVVAEAQRVSELTHGAFDVTVAPLVRLWGFDADGRPEQIPTPAQIDFARKRVGFRQLEFRSEPPALRKRIPELTVNLSAIAKGYGVDVLSEYLEDAGIDDYMVEIGGEVRTNGQKPDGQAWRIGIEQPTAAAVGQPIRAIEPGRLSMATSGDYRNFYSRAGKTYSHTIDPATGRPVQSTLASATILSTSCMRADALATAIMVLGPDEGMALAEREKSPAMLLTRNAEGDVAVTSNAAFDRLLADSQSAETAEQPITVYLTSLVVFAVALVGMAIGVIVSNRRIKGSCGGLNNFKDEQGNSICDACTTPPEECEQVRAAAAGAASQGIGNHQGGTEEMENS